MMKLKFHIFWLLIGLCSLGGCYDEPTADPKTVITAFKPVNSKIEADGYATTEVNVELPTDAGDDRRTVTFKTDKGVFIETEKNEASIKAELASDGKLIARVHLRSITTVGRANLTATIKEVNDTTSVVFSRAYPTQLIIKTDKLAIRPSFDNEVAFVIELKRPKGVVSIGTVAKLTVLDSLKKQEIGLFRNPQRESDESGKCSFFYTLGASSYLGRLRVVASVQDSVRQKPVEEELTIYALPK